MIKHELKIDPDNFIAIKLGIKQFELRIDDREFEVGDFLRLRKTKHTAKEMSHGALLVYTGDEITVSVDYILCGPAHGLSEGWVAMSINRV